MARFKHPLHGTCVPGCPLYGLCHCGCGEHTRINPKTYSVYGVVAHRPSVFRQNHNPRQTQHLKVGGKGTIPVSRVFRLLDFLQQEHRVDSSKALSLRLGLGEGVVLKIRTTQKHVTRATASRIVAAVLALQPPNREHQARPPTSWEQDRSRREGTRQYQAGYRRGEKRIQPKAIVDAKARDLCRCGKPKGIAAKRCYACFRADESKAFQKASRGRASLTGKGPARSLESPRRSA